MHKTLTILLLAGLGSACGGPFYILPGGPLEGPEVSSPWQTPTADGLLQLETNPSAPYSVNLGYRLIAGGIYIDPAEDRRWYQYIAEDPRVRIRFDGDEHIHTAATIAVTDEAIISQFDADRIVLRLQPRTQ